MAISDNRDPNQLRKDATAKVAKAKALNAMLEDGSHIGSRAENEDRIDSLLKEAEADKAEAEAIEAREDESIKRHRAGGKPSRLSSDPFGLNSRKLGEVSFAADSEHSFNDWLAADDSQLDNAGFDSLHDMLSSMYQQTVTQSAHDDRLKYLASQHGSDGPSGGFTMPELFHRDLIRTVVARDPWLSQLTTRVIPPREGRSMVFPILSDRNRQTVESDGSTEPNVGGVHLHRTAETGTIEVSNMRFQSRKVELSKAAVRVPISNELLSDSGGSGVEIAINEVFAQAVSQRMGLDVLGGTGVGEPQGIISASATYVQAKEGSQTADTITGANLLGMRQRAALYEDMIWVTHPSAYLQLLSAHTALTNTDYPLFIHGNGTDVPDTVLGRPIYFSESAPVLGDKGDITLFRPQSYYYVMKPMRIDMSAHRRFDTDETEMRCVVRDDGTTLYDSIRTDAKGYESSEFVTLAERA